MIIQTNDCFIDFITEFYLFIVKLLNTKHLKKQYIKENLKIKSTQNHCYYLFYAEITNLTPFN